jgi:NADPH-dependent 2,4-dienoyl-CoA reductase/sulfur reductase-like enzyme
MWTFLAALSCTPAQETETIEQAAEQEAAQTWTGPAQGENWRPSQRVVIIGAGPAGLAAAMDLPGALVLEAGDRTGGRAPGSNQLLYFVGSVQLQGDTSIGRRKQCVGRELNE